MSALLVLLAAVNGALLATAANRHRRAGMPWLLDGGLCLLWTGFAIWWAWDFART